MADQNTPDLLVPDRSIVSLDEARRELDAKKDRRGTGPGDDFVTRKQMLVIIDKIGDGMGDAAIAVGQKVYDQIAEETQGLLAEMHANIRREILLEVEARSLRGRARALWRRFVAPAQSAPALVVDAVEALDPNVAAVVHQHAAVESEG